LNELRANIRARTPADYSFVEDKCRVLVAGDQVCGWSRNLEVSGNKTVATICFGFNISVSSSLSGGWPFIHAVHASHGKIIPAEPVSFVTNKIAYRSTPAIVVDPLGSSLA
jgi:hypothetical protein